MIETKDLEKKLQEDVDIDVLLKEVHDYDFNQYIHYLLDKYQLKQADIIRKSGLDRRYAYKIFRGEKGKGNKDKLYRIALAMQLSQRETNHLLSLGNTGELYAHNGRDLIMLRGLIKKQSIEDVNIELMDQGYDVLKD